MKKQITLAILLLTGFNLSVFSYCSSEIREKKSSARSKAIWGTTLLIFSGFLFAQREIQEKWYEEKKSSFLSVFFSPDVISFTISSLALTLYGFSFKDWYEANEIEKEHANEQKTLFDLIERERK